MGEAPRILSPEEMERAIGFPTGWTIPSDSFIDDPPDGIPPRPTHILRRNAVGNAIAVPILSRLILAMLMALKLVPAAGTPKFPQWADPSLPCPYFHEVADDLLVEAESLAEPFADLTSAFDAYWGGDPAALVGADPGAMGRKNRAQRAAAGGRQLATHIGKKGLSLMIPEGATLEEHVRVARTLAHPFTSPPEIPADLCFAAAHSASDPPQADRDRAVRMSRLQELASDCASLDRKFRQRQSSAVARAAASLWLGFLSVLLFLLRWPDWAITSLFVRGFKVTGIVDPSNVYQSIAP